MNIWKRFKEYFSFPTLHNMIGILYAILYTIVTQKAISPTIESLEKEADYATAIIDSPFLSML